jgi:hypothetical protein
MKKSTLLISFLLLGMSAIGQNVEPTIFGNENSSAEKAPYKKSKPGIMSKALWDIQLLTDVTASSGSLGQAAVAFHNNEFWTSTWANDTLIRYSNTGALIQKFVITGLTGTRSITSDGTNLYMGKATNVISIVNPTTLTVTGTITAPAAARFLTYDATLNGGAGGFWLGNFSTDIISIDMSGTLLSTIPAATHGLTGMYGAAIDNTSLGGPYLWVHNQGGASQDQFTALQMPSGTPTVLGRDVLPDLSSLGITSSLAGGAFVTNSLVSGQTSLIGLCQGTPTNAIIAYELSVPSSIIDVSANSLRPQKGYTQIPESQVFGEVFDITYSNASTQMLDSVVAEIEIFHNGTSVSTQSAFALNVPSAGTGTLNSPLFTASNGTGTYKVKIKIRPDVSVTDNSPANDTLSFTFQVTDSIFARDNSIATGTPYVVSTTDSAYAASMFEVFVTDTVTGVWIQLTNPVQSDLTYPIVSSHAGGLPGSLISKGYTTTIDGTINQYYLKFKEMLILTPGTYAFGCFEGLNTGINLSQSTSLYTPGTNYFNIGGTWTGSNIQTARFIRPIFGDYVSQHAGVAELTERDILVYPIPASDQVNVVFNSPLNEITSVNIMSVTGTKVSSSNIDAGTQELTIPTSGLTAGVYFLEFKSTTFNGSKRIVIK